MTSCVVQSLLPNNHGRQDQSDIIMISDYDIIMISDYITIK